MGGSKQGSSANAIDCETAPGCEYRSSRKFEIHKQFELDEEPWSTFRLQSAENADETGCCGSPMGVFDWTTTRPNAVGFLCSQHFLELNVIAKPFD